MKGKFIMENLCETKDEDLSLKLSKLKSDEVCFTIFSHKKVRDDGLPLLYLHGRDCWYGTGHVCPCLPENASDDAEEDFALDLDFYNPTKHTMIEWVIMGDVNTMGSYLDWTRVEEIINKQYDANLLR